MNPDPGAIGRAVGRYEILRQIGHGAMATVHLARQLDLDRDVALKELDRAGVEASAVLTSRFLREAKLAGSLSHPNIVTVHEYFEHDGRAFIAMEYVERGSLRGHLAGLSLSQIVGVLDGLLAALTHAEARGIVHRDIKPENVLVTADGRIKVADFGIASAYSLLGGARLTATGTSIGTPMYMSPEQATGKPISIATDLYAVGIVAFEMLFGYVPFGSGETPLAVIWQHVNEPLPDPRALRPDLDPALCRWLERLLAKDAADRPASAAVALDALEEIALELLGNRWRRDAPLLAGATAPAPAGERPPRSQPPAPAAPTDACPPRSRPPAPAAPAGERPTGTEATTRRVAAVPPRHDAGSRATRDAGRSTSVPRVPPTPTAQHDPAPLATTAHHDPAPLATTAHHDLSRADAPVDVLPGPPPRARRPVVVAVLLVAAVLIPAAGAYLASHRDATTAPPSPSHAVTADSIAAARFADGLGTVFESLNRTRVSARQRLATATTARRQAVQARAVASAYRRAATATARLTPAAGQRAAAARLRAELTRTAKAYDALAAAAHAHRPKTYAAQRRAVGTHESAVRSAAAAIDGVGGIAA